MPDAYCLMPPCLRVKRPSTPFGGFSVEGLILRFRQIVERGTG